MKVTVFGGAAPQPGDSSYEEARQFGEMLGRGGHTVITGGYKGTMEAVSRGAAEAGGHVIGITCQEIETWRSTRANAWVQEEVHCETLQDRLDKLIISCEAAIALPGGPGTLTEISLMWNRLLIGSISKRPLILIGPGWKNTFETIYSNLGEYFLERDRQLVSFARDIHHAFDLLTDGKK
jgi:uncharacterized protein (TIGR00725 family)